MFQFQHCPVARAVKSYFISVPGRHPVVVGPLGPQYSWIFAWHELGSHAHLRQIHPPQPFVCHPGFHKVYINIRSVSFAQNNKIRKIISCVDDIYIYIFPYWFNIHRRDMLFSTFVMYTRLPDHWKHQFPAVCTPYVF